LNGKKNNYGTFSLYMTATVHRIWVAYVSPRTSFVLTYEGVVEEGSN